MAEREEVDVGESVHQVSSDAGGERIFYVRTDGNYDVFPEPTSEEEQRAR